MNTTPDSWNDDALDRLAQRLPDISPPEGMWDRIEADLREEQRLRQERSMSPRGRIAAFFQRPVVTYGLFALLLAAGSAASYVLLSTEDDLDFSFFERKTDMELLLEADADIDQAITHYERAIATLTVIAEQSEAELDPEYVRLQKEKMQLLRASIAECRVALAQNRENPQVQHYLLSAYSSLQLSLQEMVSRTGQKKGDRS